MNLTDFGIFTSRQYIERGGVYFPVTVFTRGENEIVTNRVLLDDEIAGIVEDAQKSFADYSLFFRVALRLNRANLI